MLPEIKNLEEFKNVVCYLNLSRAAIQYRVDQFCLYRLQTGKDKVAVIDFWAAWCLPCKAISPIFEAFALRHPELGFYKVNVSEAREVSQAAGVRGVRL